MKCQYCGKELKENEKSIICLECDRELWTNNKENDMEAEELD